MERFVFALGGTQRSEDALYDESGAAYRQMLPKELKHEEQSKGEKMKAMISQPMAGKTDAEITATREKAIQYLESEGYKVVDSYFKDEFAEPTENVNKGIYFLAKSLEKMSECTAVYFCRGAQAARGCRIERAVAEAYGLMCIDEPGKRVPWEAD